MTAPPALAGHRGMNRLRKSNNDPILLYGHAVTNDRASGGATSGVVGSTIGRHLILSVCFVLFYLFLSSPTVIVISHLGFTVWYPATGLIFALLLGVSPRYAVLAVFADSFAGALIYHQPIRSWGETLGALGSISCYALAAYLLRGPLRIDSGLRHRNDVVRYVFISLCAAVGATAEVGDTLDAIYRAPARVALSAALHFGGWTASAVGAWIAFNSHRQTQTSEDRKQSETAPCERQSFHAKTGTP